MPGRAEIVTPPRWALGAVFGLMLGAIAFGALSSFPYFDDAYMVLFLREAGLECRIAVCVVDREEGGADALARRGARLVPLFRAGEWLPTEKTAAKPHG